MLGHHIQAVETHSVHRVAISLEHGKLRGLRTHTSGVAIQIADAAVGGEGAARLVVPVPAAVIAFDARLLLAKSWIWQI
jgi:hypothetical protein